MNYKHDSGHRWGRIRAPAVGVAWGLAMLSVTASFEIGRIFRHVIQLRSRIE